MDFTPFQLPVAKVVRETPDAISIHFDDSAHPIQYTSGQFLTIEMEVNGKKQRRSYSLCSAPGIDAQPAVCVKKVKDGAVSTRLLDSLKPGDRLTVFPAIGTYTYKPDASKRRHIVLVGAGSGITPLISIAKSALKNEPDSSVSLIYGNRTPNSIIFKDQIQAMEAANPGRFRVVHVLSGQLTETHSGPLGRITGTLVEELLYHLNPVQDVQATEVYLCGPQGMMESVEERLRANGVAKANIHRESFFSDNLAANPAPPTPPHEHDGPDMVKIILDGDEFEFEVPEGSTILEAGLDNDVDMPYSCQSGLCTACRGRCLEGGVEMAETEGLSDAELDQGYVLLCVGRPKSSRTVVEIG